MSPAASAGERFFPHPYLQGACNPTRPAEEHCMEARSKNVMTQLALLAAALLVALAVAAPVAQADDFYGVNAGHEVMGLPAAQRDAHLAEMKKTGISIVRVDASWSSVEPLAPVAGVHVWKWEPTDKIAAVLAAQGLRWYPMLGYATNWSTSVRGNIFSGPSNVQDYAAFVAAFAARYGKGGAFWAAHPELPNMPTSVYEIWNEQNYDHFWSNQDGAPAAYADLYLAARAALRSVDASAKAVVGGLIDPDAEQFLTGMLTARPGLAAQIDAVGYHPYRASDADSVVNSIESMRMTMTRGGISTKAPIEITEIGWFAEAMPEADRAKVMRIAARTVRRADLNVSRFMPYVWMGGSYSLRDAGGHVLPTGAAYGAAIGAVAGAQMQALGKSTVAGGKKVAKKKGKKRVKKKVRR